MDLDAFRWLLTEPGQRLLAGRQAVGRRRLPVGAGSALRRTAARPHVAAALTQVGAARRAEAKFGDLAARMYFTPDGLEQATRLTGRHPPGRPRPAPPAPDRGRPRLRHRR